MYEPKLPPDVVDPELQRVIDWCKEELAAIALDGAALNSLELRTVHAEPAKPREGMIVEADGTDWDPGDGAGQYSFRGGVWVRQHSAGDTFTLAADITDEGALAYLDEVDLAHMADLQQNRVIGRNTSGTGVPEALSIETVLAWLGNTRGQVLRRGSSVWEALALGAAGTVLVSDGTDAVWGSSAWVTELDVNATTSGANCDFTDIDSSYTHLLLYLDRVSFSGTATLNLSADTSNTFGSLINISGSQVAMGSGTTSADPTDDTTAELVGAVAALVMTGFILVLNYSKTDRYKTVIAAIATDVGTCFISCFGIESTSLIDNLRLSLSANAFDAGQVILGGIK